MDYTDITKIARDLAGVSQDNSDFSDANLLVYVNKNYHKLEDTIRRYINKKYFYNIFTANLVDDQSEYSIPEWALDVLRVERYIEWVWYKELARNDVRWQNSTYPESITDDNYYEFIDNSIFLYPTPTEAVEDWLKVEATIRLDDLAIDSEETDIFPRHKELISYHDILWEMTAQDILKQQQKFDILANIKTLADESVKTMLHSIKWNNNKRIKCSIDLSWWE